MLKEYKEYLDCTDITYAENEPLSKHTSFRIGGPCSFYVSPSSADSFKDAYNFARSLGIGVYILGKGSNVVFPDEGFKGVVLSTEKLNEVTCDGNSLIAGSGVSFTQLAVVARDASLEGLEFAYGIPGTVGGAVFMNAGAYGGEVSRCLKSSCCYDPETDRIICTEGLAHEFGYRTSIYKKNPQRIILSAEFELREGNKEEIRAKMEDFMFRRRDKQPLEYPSAGSVFKRPEGFFAGKLIEDCGLKGFYVGSAQVSEKHAGFIINRGGATQKDVLGLVEHIKKTVFDKFGVMLECEIIFVK